MKAAGEETESGQGEARRGDGATMATAEKSGGDRGADDGKAATQHGDARTRRTGSRQEARKTATRRATTRGEEAAEETRREVAWRQDNGFGFSGWSQVGLSSGFQWCVGFQVEG